jgi:hypothetical protein
MNETITVAAAIVLVLWACWCGFSRSVNDGIVGKAIYFWIAVSSLAIVLGVAELRTYQTLIVAFAMLGVRHYWLRYVKKQLFKKAAA